MVPTAQNYIRKLSVCGLPTYYWNFCPRCHFNPYPANVENMVSS